MVDQEEKLLTERTDSEEAQIIVVDDEEKIVEFMKVALQHRGHKVTGCTDPEHAIEKIKMEIYDLIITDLNMPKISGVKFVKKVKKYLPKLM